MSDSLRDRLLVLVVDDSELQLTYERELLADQCFDFLVARNGVEAIATARRFHPDVILLDIEMPLMDGIETARNLRGNGDTLDIPIIMVTQHCGPGELEKAFEGGCNDYVAKPVHKPELLAKIQALTGFTVSGYAG